jgi:hypothetical protein
VGGGVLEEAPLLAPTTCGEGTRTASGDELTRVRRLGFCDEADKLDAGV